MIDFHPSKPGGLLFFMKLPGTVPEIRLMRGFTLLDTELNPVEYSRRYADEQDGEVEPVGYFPAVRCAFDRLYGDPVHAALAACFESGATGGDAVFTLYTADISGGAPPYPCRRRDFTFVPSSIHAGSGGAGLPAYSYAGTFHARGMTDTGRAALSPDGQTLTFYED